MHSHARSYAHSWAECGIAALNAFRAFSCPVCAYLRSIGMYHAELSCALYGMCNTHLVQPSPLLSAIVSQCSTDEPCCSNLLSHLRQRGNSLNLSMVRSLQCNQACKMLFIGDVDRRNFNDPTAADNSCPPKMVPVDIKSGSIVDADAFSCVPEALRACTQRQAPDNSWWRALSPP